MGLAVLVNGMGWIKHGLDGLGDGVCGFHSHHWKPVDSVVFRHEKVPETLAQTNKLVVMGSYIVLAISLSASQSPLASAVRLECLNSSSLNK